MEEFGLVEADFQQYYHLNLVDIYDEMIDEGRGFLRYSRLFENLPAKSRIWLKISPASSWTWRDEVFSRLLRELSEIKSLTYNSKRKKGQNAIKPDEQFQPGYVKEAKDTYLKQLEEEKLELEDPETMRAFWQARNPDVKIM